jgi:hypothetical protein
MGFAALNPSYTTLNSEGIRAQAPHALLRYPGAIVRFHAITVDVSAVVGVLFGAIPLNKSVFE